MGGSVLQEEASRGLEYLTGDWMILSSGIR